MIKTKSESYQVLEIDCSGPTVNSFYLINTARILGTRSGMSITEVELIVSDMKSGDYDHLIEVFDEHFGDLVIIYK